jgi:hypothetical protein
MIRYSKHARDAMSSRDISAEWVESAIMFADRSERDPKHPERTRSFKAITGFGDRILRVVHRPEGAGIVIITVHFDRSAKP